MSLINDVLSDINKKQAPVSKVKDCFQTNPFDKDQAFLSPKLKRLMIIFLAANVLCLTGLAIYKAYLVHTLSARKIATKEKIIITDTIKHAAIQRQKNQPTLFEVASLIPSIEFANFDLKSKYQPGLTSINRHNAFENLNDKPRVNKGKKKESFFIKQYAPLTKRELSEERYQKALNLIEKEALNEAASELESIIQNDSNFVLPRISLAKLLLELNKVDQALSLATKSMAMFPLNLDLIEINADIFLQKNQPEKALKLLQALAPNMDEGSADYYNLMAVAYEKMNQLSQAGGIYQQLIRIRPEKGAYWLGLALALENASQMNQAIGAYAKAMEAYDTSSVIASYAKNRISVLRG